MMFPIIELGLDTLSNSVGGVRFPLLPDGHLFRFAPCIFYHAASYIDLSLCRLGKQG